MKAEELEKTVELAFFDFHTLGVEPAAGWCVLLAYLFCVFVCFFFFLFFSLFYYGRGHYYKKERERARKK